MATRTITTSIKLDGEKEFKSQMSSVNSELKTLKSEMALNTAEFKGQANTVEALTAKDKILRQEVVQQQEKVKALEQAVKDASDAYGENDKRVDSYKQQLNNAKASLANLNSSIEQNGKYMQEAESSTDGCAKSIDEYGKEIKDAGEKSLTAGDLIKANLTSEAIIGGLKALGNAVAGVAREFKETVLAASDYGSAVNDTAAKTGMSTDSLQKWQYAAGLCGVENEKLTSLMVKQQKSFSDAAEGSKTASEAYNRMGIDIESVGSSSDAFDLVMQKLAGMTDETERNALANDIFGKSYADLSPLLAEGADGMEELRQKAEDIGAVMSEDAVAAADAFGDSLDTLKAAFGGLKNNLAGDFLPSITTIMDGMTAVMSGDVDAGVAAIEQGIADFGVQIEALGPMAQQVLDLIVTVITENLPTILDMGTQVIISLVDGICKQMPELVPTVIDLILTVVNTLLDNVDLLVDAAMQLTVGIATGLIKAIPRLVAQLPRIIAAIANGLLSGIGSIADIGRNLVEGLWNGIGNMASWIGDKIKGFGQGIVNGLKSFFGIHSPSTVMRDQIGQYLGKGVTEGFANGIDEQAMADAIPSNFEVAAKLNTSLKTPNLGAEYTQSINTALSANGGTLALLQSVNEKLDKIAEMGIYLDGNTLVGGISGRMDGQLQKLNVARRRT